jgi:hypothetical protein
MVNWSPSLQTAVSDLVSFFGCVGTFFLFFFLSLFIYFLIICFTYFMFIFYLISVSLPFVVRK